MARKIKRTSAVSRTRPDRKNELTARTEVLSPIKWVQNGFTLAHNPNAVFLHGALPGEKVEALITDKKSKHSFAITKKVIDASPDRITSDCDAFPECGGCSFRHLSYENELKTKVSLLKELPNLGSLISESNVHHGSPNEYRNNVQLRFHNGSFGFLALHTNRVVPLPEGGCKNVSAELNDFIAEARVAYRVAAENNPRDSKSRHEQTATFRQFGEQLFMPEEPGKRISYPINVGPVKSWDYPMSGFIQSNRFLFSEWLLYLRERFIAIASGTRPDVCELYSGSAIIGGVCRDLIGKYSGFESVRSSVKAAIANFRKHDFSGEFEELDLEKEAPDLDGAVCIANPGRPGFSPLVRQAIAESSLSALIYSSCNPHTLDRDLAQLQTAGFVAIDCAVFDFFPRTPHVEVVLSLRRS